MRFTLVDDDRHGKLLCQRQLHPEGVFLDLARDILVVIVQPDLADGAHAGVLAERTVARDARLVHMVCVVRVAADGGPDPVVALGQRDGALGRGQVAANVHHARDAIFPHPGENVVKIGLKAGVVQMGVGIEIHRNLLIFAPMVRDASGGILFSGLSEKGLFNPAFFPAWERKRR